jgi:hypothetical protein
MTPLSQEDLEALLIEYGDDSFPVDNERHWKMMLGKLLWKLKKMSKRKVKSKQTVYPEEDERTRRKRIQRI